MPNRHNAQPSLQAVSFFAPPLRLAKPTASAALHPARIVRATGALRHYPVDILRRVLDVAGLAMHAVLRVDLQLRITSLLADDLVHPGRAISRLRAAVFVPVDGNRLGRIQQRQMRRLVFLVIGIRDKHR